MQRREFALKVNAWLNSGPPETTHNENYWFLMLEEYAKREFNFLYSQLQVGNTGKTPDTRSLQEGFDEY